VKLESAAADSRWMYSHRLTPRCYGGLRHERPHSTTVESNRLQRLGMAESLVSLMPDREPPGDEHDWKHPKRTTFVRSSGTLGRSAMGRRTHRNPDLRRIDCHDIRTL